MIVLGELRAAPGQSDDLKQLMLEMLPGAQQREGFQSLYITQDIEDKHRLVLVERWASREAHESYMAWRLERGDFEKLGPLMAEPPSTAYLEPKGASAS
jgi:quinol monooxygenase YgiN